MSKRHEVIEFLSQSLSKYKLCRIFNISQEQVIISSEKPQMKYLMLFFMFSRHIFVISVNN